MSERDRIIVALDFSSEQEALACADRLQGIATYMKVGMQLYYAAGPQIVYALKERGFNVFVDLKVHDIPNTAKGAMQSLASLGADMVNVHVAGGKDMMTAAKEGLESGAAGQTKPLLIGVTQLTSSSQQMMNDEIGIEGTIVDCAQRYAQLAKAAGLDGVVASPLEVEAIKRSCGPTFKTVTPGVRPRGAELGDQKRVVTPAEAFAFGTDYIVVGRPITQASDPLKAMRAMVESIGG
ncbi:orotidine-5'-phosphate decarboxylase [Ammoniphilus oxalaticus]|uniref:orotidine-5'-phosphate decarboxylase n=1 Tax=Ammoniphilus oxalaticus TaxID=66863 RepID=UPI0026C1C50D